MEEETNLSNVPLGTLAQALDAGQGDREVILSEMRVRTAELDQLFEANVGYLDQVRR